MRDLLDLSFNLRIWTVDAQGRKVQERAGHNIFLDNGKNWLGQLLAYNTTGYVRADPPPDLEPAIAGAPYTRTVAAPSLTTADVYMPFLPFYVGVGLGGNQQSGPIPADVAADYPGTNIQSDSDPTVTGLERPVRITLDAPVPVWARWVNPIQVTLPVPPITYVRYTATFSTTDINIGTTIAGGNYADVPISEAALYAWTTDPDTTFTTYPPALAFVQGQALAYHTFPLINKTAAVGLVVQWDLLFGT